MLVPSRPFLNEPGPTFWATLRYFSITRLLIAGVLLGAVLLAQGQIIFGQTDPDLFERSATAYLIAAAIFVYIAKAHPRRLYLQLVAQLLVDLAVVTLMMHASDGTRGGMAIMYLLPVAGAAMLSPPLLASGFAALAALMILGETLLRTLESDIFSVGMVQAGLYGAACFAIAILVNRLAARVLAQEGIAARRGKDLQRQIEINRLVVGDMQDGVLVFSEDGSPRTLNPAAARMLHVQDPARLLAAGWGAHPAGRMIHERFLEWRNATEKGDDSFELVLGEERTENDPARRRLRGRFVSPLPDKSGSDYVVFLEDMQRVDEQAQQLKLASMGRLTASIAHEIRNPLAAISHASALLAEGQLSEPDLRLLNIVHDNTRRLDRIVENILQLSRRGPVSYEDVRLGPFLDDLVSEFCRDHSFDARAIDISVFGEPTVRFNPEHLRQVLMNLLQNARRHSSGRASSISIVVVPVVPNKARGGHEDEAATQHEVDRIELIVQDDGKGIDAEIRNHLFEPFFTTHHRGTGLGLYLARELCLANGATLGYAHNADPSKKGGFVVNVAGHVDMVELTEHA